MSFNNTNYLYLDLHTEGIFIEKISERELTSSVAFYSIHSTSSKTSIKGRQKSSFAKLHGQYLQFAHNKDPPFVYLSL